MHLRTTLHKYKLAQKCEPNNELICDENLRLRTKHVFFNKQEKPL